MPKPPRSFLYLALLGAFLLTAAFVVRSGMLARNDPGPPLNSAMREAVEDQGMPRISEADQALIAERYPGAQITQSGLMYLVRTPGLDPTRARIGQTVVAHYDGRLLDGTRFDSSFERREPITFQVGLGQVVKGWDEAFLGMRKGERRTLIVPYWLGYGIQGRPPTIPPRSTLVFDVELLEMR